MLQAPEPETIGMSPSMASALLRIVLWEHFNGTIPDGMEVDHKEGWANSIDNLRVATRGQNVRNTKAQHNNKTGLKGVSPSKCGFYGRVDRKSVV